MIVPLVALELPMIVFSSKMMDHSAGNVSMRKLKTPSGKSRRLKGEAMEPGPGKPAHTLDVLNFGLF